MLVHYIFDVANGGVYSRMWACLLLYPYTFVSSLGMPAAKCKLGDFTLANLATALAYIPVGFYVGDAYSEAWIAGVSVTFGTIVPWIVIFLFQAFHLIPSPGLPITQQLPYSAANFFDLLTGYFICASDHKNAISAESEEFSQVCFAAAKQKLPVKLSSVFWNIAGELFSLKDCLLIQDLEPGIIAYIWKPLATDFSLLRSEVGIVLRKTARGVPEEADRNLDGRIVHCGELIIDVVSDLNRRAVEGSIKRPSTTAIVQFYYALGSMMYIAGLAEKYRVASVAQKREEQQARLDKKNRVLIGVLETDDKVVSALDDFYYQTEGLARNGVHSDGDSTTADEATPPPVISDDREQFGAAGFKSMAERAALLDDAKVETIVFKKIHLVHDVTKRVLKNQKLMNEVLRDGLVLYSSLVLSAKHLNDPSVSQALFPLVGSIRELAKAIKTSSDRMVNYLYDAGSTPGMLDHLPSDVHALVEECADNFQSFRKDVVEDVMNGGNKLQAMRGINGVSFCHTVYALTMFAERWNALEAQLHSGGHNATVELATRPPPAQMALMVLRSRSNMV
ncbi:hypothetical protein FOL47_007241 [Perkinsus chesapeaki]|uniref:Uncharacterized protein n=1 Tax=Perkinsus chesapeaki TaxID=330153 RepID=A0A7J6MW12_PERCH|nr:hypothetical protein FOL47_007241 [Perkinsus chesapeaki]